MAIHCPECGEQILSRKAGFCPGCHKELPEELKLDHFAKDFLDGQYDRTRRAIRPLGDGAAGFWGGDFGGDCSDGGGGGE